MTNNTRTCFDFDRHTAKPWNPAATDEDIFYCFRLLLGRNPSLDEWQWHLCKNGSDLTATVKSYLGSLEFSKRGMLLQDSSLDDLRAASVNGAKIYIHANDPVIGRSVFANAYEPEVVRVFRDNVKARMSVVDVGANIGFYTMLSATLVGTSGQVLAVEPNLANVRLLEASRRLNGFENVMVAPMAASDRTGVLALHAGESNGTTTQLENANDVLEANELVPCVSVDALLGKDQKIDFIKVDVEGAEALAIKGMRDVIHRCKPVIVSEFSPESLPTFSGCTGKEYLDMLIGMGYSICVIETEKVVDYGTDAFAVMQAFERRHSDHIDLLCKSF